MNDLAKLDRLIDMHAESLTKHGLYIDSLDRRVSSLEKLGEEVAFCLSPIPSAAPKDWKHGEDGDWFNYWIGLRFIYEQEDGWPRVPLELEEFISDRERDVFTQKAINLGVFADENYLAPHAELSKWEIYSPSLARVILGNGGFGSFYPKYEADIEYAVSGRNESPEWIENLSKTLKEERPFSVIRKHLGEAQVLLDHGDQEGAAAKLAEIFNAAHGGLVHLKEEGVL